MTTDSPETPTAPHVLAWLRDLGAVRRLAPKTLEAYGRDLQQFMGFLAQHTGGPVTLALRTLPARTS